jgi:hypothetical protein
VFFESTVLTEKDVLEHRLVAMEKQRRYLVKTQRYGEMSGSFWFRTGIKLTNGAPQLLATPEFTKFTLIQEALERKVNWGGGGGGGQRKTSAGSDACHRVDHWQTAYGQEEHISRA